MDTGIAYAASPGISGDELREYLKRPMDPALQERQDRAFREMVGSMSEEEADAFERRINSMCEVVEGERIAEA